MVLVIHLSLVIPFLIHTWQSVLLVILNLTVVVLSPACDRGSLAKNCVNESSR